MAAITAGMVAELRGKTDAPMMECKKALTEANITMLNAIKNSIECSMLNANIQTITSFCDASNFLV